MQNGRLTSVVHPCGGTTEICFDERGRRSTMLDPDGTLTTYKWNDRDRLVEITRSTADARTWRLSIGHDPFGTLRQIAGDGFGPALRGVLLGRRTVAVTIDQLPQAASVAWVTRRRRSRASERRRCTG